MHEIIDLKTGFAQMLDYDEQIAKNKEIVGAINGAAASIIELSRQQIGIFQAIVTSIEIKLLPILGETNTNLFKFSLFKKLVEETEIFYLLQGLKERMEK